MFIKSKVLASLLILSFFIFPLTVLAEEVNFNPHYIISNQEMRDSACMDYSQIESFLIRKGNLNQRALIDKDGIVKPATEIIYWAARNYQISPKVLLVTLQKEQSLIEDENPTSDQLDWAMGYAVCDDCSKSDPMIQKFKGFGKQVDSAAKRFNDYFQNPNQFNFKAGETYNIDGQSVTINNQATANLYIYTPHIHGNQNFRKIWDRWFKRTYPDGSLVKAVGAEGEKEIIYVIERGLKREIASMSILLSRYDADRIIEVNASDLDQYPDGIPIRLANYSLLSSPKGTVYLLVDDTLRGFASAEVFKTMGYNFEEVEEVSFEDLAVYQEGLPLTIKSIYPIGALLQDKTTGGVYYVEEGMKHPIWSKEIMDINYPHRKITPVSPEELDQYTTAEPAMFRDGELVMSPSSSTVYVISNGQKLPIADEATFNGLGYKWHNIIVTTDQALALHQTGEELKWLE